MVCSRVHISSFSIVKLARAPRRLVALIFLAGLCACQTSVGRIAGENTLKGRWTWTGDAVLFGDGGRGTYLRNEDLCFAFSYSVEGDILHIISDTTHSCGIGTDFRYRLIIQGNQMTWTHVGSGFKTVWKKQSPEQPLQTARTPPQTAFYPAQ